MSAIAAASVSLKTMADGTLRITFDVEPTSAQEAFALFGSPGTPAALAALKVGYAAVTNEPKEERPKGGTLAKLAGQLCNNPEFIAFVNVSTPEEAAESIRIHCNIDSRSQLDHDEKAAKTFHEIFRIPFAELRRNND